MLCHKLCHLNGICLIRDLITVTEEDVQRAEKITSLNIREDTGI